MNKDEDFKEVSYVCLLSKFETNYIMRNIHTIMINKIQALKKLTHQYLESLIVNGLLITVDAYKYITQLFKLKKIITHTKITVIKTVI